MLHTEDLVPMIRAVVMCQHAVLQVLLSVGAGSRYTT